MIGAEKNATDQTAHTKAGLGLCYTLNILHIRFMMGAERNGTDQTAIHRLVWAFAVCINIQQAFPMLWHILGFVCPFEYLI